MAASTSRPSSPLLPAFGIRDLNSPPSSLGLVQISRRQYDNTIQSQPDATLTYIDLDDGEVITVGSSFELSQRLEEPVSSSTYRGRSPVSTWCPLPNALEDEQNKIHIFDIRRTNGNLAVWRDHEAYSCKSLRKQDTSSSTASRSTSPSASEPQPMVSRSCIPPVQSEGDLSAALSSLRINHEPSASCTASKTPNLHPARDEPAHQLDSALNDVFTGLESHLGPLADILEATAGGLRKIAEKTREADSSPVEDVLNGFHSIITEIGQLGQEFLATLDGGLEQTKIRKPAEDPFEAERQQLPPKPPSRHGTPSPRPDPQPDNESVVKKVSFIDATTAAAPPSKFPTAPFELVNQEEPGVQTRTFTLPPVPTPFAPFGRGLRQKGVVELPPPCAKPSLMTTFGPPARHDTAKDSIIDSQPSDSDILTRYPPLPSLRKAASVSGLRARPEATTRYQPGLSTTSALSRYPSIGQFEQLSRISSRNGPSSKPGDTRDSELDWTFPLRMAKKRDEYKKPRAEDVHENDVVVVAESPVTPAAETTNSIPQDKDNLAKVDGISEKQQDALKRRPASCYPPPPPGAWPEQKMDNWSTPKPDGDKNPPAGSSETVASTQEQISSGFSSRISSPVSEAYNRAPVFPRKSQTVSGTNPAARLNGPFDPLAHIPVLQPRPQRSQPDLSVPKLPSLSAKYKPSAFPDAFPRRSQTVHYTDRYKPRHGPYQYSRPSLWENGVKVKHSSNTVPTTLSHTRPWSFYPEASHPSQGPSFPGPAHPENNHPIFPTIRPVQSMIGLRPEAGKTAQPFTSRYAPPNPQVPAPIRTHIINTIPVPPPKPVPHPVSAPPRDRWGSPVTSTSRSASILSPCPPTSTQRRSHSGIFGPAPLASKGVDECVRQLKAMGFGSDPHELARLNVYAGAAAGDVEAAIEMIEEDREAARELETSSQVGQVGSVRDVGRDFDAGRNPWED
ncbi:hypothetical protein A1O7_04285 [Cladophialophora yegresii CBS 114405]|uniref:Uncharacterized protein n=1 Tax=Cladophialophora yegresii CBS 114405 TaxID=1182544 RepID=W9VWS1_9EURO|nr:uncharacterized protein A1O7_04285 [Cladophialophora yegresii CBS 114405]EXJ60133.1 hypothetical protein A1O7_04285 [Cladophialophora yegresii CBS 114405]